MTAMQFGDIDILSAARFDTAATLTISCSGGPMGVHAVRACVSIGSGQMITSPPRGLLNGPSVLNMEIYAVPVGGDPWGAWAGGYGAYPGVAIDLAMNNGIGSAQATVYGSIFAGQQGAPSGTYINLFSDSATNMTYDLDVGTTPCPSIIANRTDLSFTASATVQPSCLVSASDLDFGAVTGLTQPVDAQTAINITCTTGLGYTVALDGGKSSASDPAQRQMINTNGSHILYGLYRNEARSLPWGADLGIDTQSGIGSANSQSLPVYGRISAGQIPPPGLYSDVIVVTVTY